MGHLPALRGGLIWDDRMYLTRGALMRRPLWKLWVAPDAIDCLPLTYTLYWLQWRIWQDSAVAFHRLRCGGDSRELRVASKKNCAGG